MLVFILWAKAQGWTLPSGAEIRSLWVADIIANSTADDSPWDAAAMIGPRSADNNYSWCTGYGQTGDQWVEFETVAPLYVSSMTVYEYHGYPVTTGLYAWNDTAGDYIALWTGPPATTNTPSRPPFSPPMNPPLIYTKRFKIAIDDAVYGYDDLACIDAISITGGALLNCPNISAPNTVFTCSAGRVQCAISCAPGYSTPSTDTLCQPDGNWSSFRPCTNYAALMNTASVSYTTVWISDVVSVSSNYLQSYDATAKDFQDAPVGAYDWSSLAWYPYSYSDWSEPQFMVFDMDAALIPLSISIYEKDDSGFSAALAAWNESTNQFVEFWRVPTRPNSGGGDVMTIDNLPIMVARRFRLEMNCSYSTDAGGIAAISMYGVVPSTCNVPVVTNSQSVVCNSQTSPQSCVVQCSQSFYPTRTTITCLKGSWTPLPTCTYSGFNLPAGYAYATAWVKSIISSSNTDVLNLVGPQDYDSMDSSSGSTGEYIDFQIDVAMYAVSVVVYEFDGSDFTMSLQAWDQSTRKFVSLWDGPMVPSNGSRRFSPPLSHPNIMTDKYRIITNMTNSSYYSLDAVSFFGAVPPCSPITVPFANLSCAADGSSCNVICLPGYGIPLQNQVIVCNRGVWDNVGPPCTPNVMGPNDGLLFANLLVQEIPVTLLPGKYIGSYHCGVTLGDSVIVGAGSELTIFECGAGGVFTVRGKTTLSGIRVQNSEAAVVVTSIGDLTVINCEFIGNTYTSSVNGGSAITNLGQLSVTDTVFISNQVTQQHDDLMRGAVFVSTSTSLVPYPTTFTNCLFEDNLGDAAVVYRVDISTQLPIMFTNCTFNNNQNGGAVRVGKYDPPLGVQAGGGTVLLSMTSCSLSNGNISAIQLTTNLFNSTSQPLTVSMISLTDTFVEPCAFDVRISDVPVASGVAAEEWCCSFGSVRNTVNPVCVACQLGSYGLNYYGPLSYCNPCPAGSFSAKTRASSSGVCRVCTPGEVSGPGSVSCSTCSAGTYANNFVECTKCPPNSFNNQTESLTCSSCPDRYAAPAGSISCSSCPAGTLPSSTGYCASCPLGSYANQTGCTRCPAGWIAGPDATSCTKCLAGTAADSGNGWCNDCPAGRFSDHDGAVNCTYCSAGKYSPEGKSVICVDCPAGVAAQCGPGTTSVVPFPTAQKMYAAVSANAVQFSPVDTFVASKPTSSRKKAILIAGSVMIGLLLLSLLLVRFVHPVFLEKKMHHFDLLFQQHHKKDDPLPAPLVLRQTPLGGIVSLMCIVTLICWGASMIDDYSNNNLTEVTSMLPGPVSLSLTPTLWASVSFVGAGSSFTCVQPSTVDTCGPLISVRAQGLATTGTTLKCSLTAGDVCQVQWSCTHCRFTSNDPGQLSLDFGGNSTAAHVLAFALVASAEDQFPGEDEANRVLGSFDPQTDSTLGLSVFQGPNPSTIGVVLHQVLMVDQTGTASILGDNSLAHSGANLAATSQQNIMLSIAPTPTNSKFGYRATVLTASVGSVASGNDILIMDSQGVHLTFLLTQADTHVVVTRGFRQSVFTFLGALAGSLAGVVSLFAALIVIVEHGNRVKTLMARTKTKRAQMMEMEMNPGGGKMQQQEVNTVAEPPSLPPAATAS